MSFKDTELGNIPTEWEIEKIDNLKAPIKNAIAMGPFGSKVKKEFFVEKGVPIIRGNNLKKFEFYDEHFVYVSEEKSLELKSSWVKKRDIVITHRGTLGQVGFIPKNSKFEKYIVSQSGMKLTCDETRINSMFLYYFLNSRLGQHLLLMNSSQVGVPAIAQASTALKNLIVPVPSMLEQQSIANILSTLDEKIETNNEINKRLVDMAQAIFKNWFVDFEFPNENGEPYKSSGGEMIESELGMIPKEWEVCRIKDLPIIVTDYVANGSFKSLKENVNLYDEKNYALFIRNTDIKSDFRTGIKYVDKHSYEFLEKTKLFGGEIIISNVGDVGSVYLCPYFGMPMTLGNNMIMLKSKENVTLNGFLFRLFKSRIGQGMIDSITGGSVQSKFNKTDFRNLKLIIPNEGLLQFYTKSIGILEENIFTNKNEIEKLSILRDTLLPKLMSGEIRVQFETKV